MGAIGYFRTYDLYAGYTNPIRLASKAAPYPNRRYKPANPQTASRLIKYKNNIIESCEVLTPKGVGPFHLVLAVFLCHGKHLSEWVLVIVKKIVYRLLELCQLTFLLRGLTHLFPLQSTRVTFSN